MFKVLHIKLIYHYSTRLESVGGPSMMSYLSDVVQSMSTGWTGAGTAQLSSGSDKIIRRLLPVVAAKSD
jgi:hypothetical protein